MRILILVFLLVSGLICYGDAARSRYEKEMDPNDPEYQEMARKLVIHMLRIKEENIKSIKVYKVTTAVVSGILTKIHVRVVLLKGIPSDCNFQVWDQPWNNVKHVSYACDDWSKTKMSGSSSPPRPEQMRDPKNPKYKKLAETSIDSFFDTPGTKPFKKEDVKALQVTVVKVQIGSKITNAIQFRVTTVKNVIFECTSIVFEKPWSPEANATVSAINCSLSNNNKLLAVLPNNMVNSGIPGGQEYKNPDDPAYEQLAKESFEEYKKKHKNVEVNVKEFKVTKATEQLVQGTVTRIDFYVIPTDYQSFPCYSEIYEHFQGRKDIKVTCVIPPKIPAGYGGETAQNPDDPKYAKLAKESFDKYQKTHLVMAKELKVTRVTRQVVDGDIYRIVFYVIGRGYYSFQCHSKITVSWRGNKDISVNCGAENKLGIVGGEDNLNLGRNNQFGDNKGSKLLLGALPSMVNSGIPGGQEYKNPDDPAYEQLANESFERYKKTHKNVEVNVKEFKVTKATEQLVHGTVTRIDFYVIPTDYQSFPCHSEIYEHFQGRKDIKVTCVIPPKIPAGYGGETAQNPDDPKYAKLAKESFDKYQKTHLVMAKELKVTRVTRQVVDGDIYRIVFYVIGRGYYSFQCHSKITVSYVSNNSGNKDISVNCGAENKRGTGGDVTEAVRRYLVKLYEHTGVQVDRIDTKSIQKVTTRVAKQKITYYKMDAFTHTLEGNYSIFNCSVLTGSWFGKKPLATNCNRNTFLMGRSDWVDPTNKKYLSFAAKSLQLHLKNSSKNEGPRDYRKYDIIVTFVLQGLAAGYVDNIKFLARWVHGNDDPMALMCQTKIWEKLDGKNDILEVHCNPISRRRNRS